MYALSSSRIIGSQFRLIVTLMILSLIGSNIACSDAINATGEAELNAFLDDTSEPPESLPHDEILRQKADVIVLPTISVSVWAIGAIIAYIGAHAVYTNTVEEFELVLGDALGGEADWSWAEDNQEHYIQAEHLSESLNQVAYRSELSDFYSVTGNDYLRFLSMASPIYILDPGALRDLLDGKVRPLGEYARAYFAALQGVSTQARHLNAQASDGLCVKATVHSIAETPIPYVARARARGPINVIPAAILASLKATIRCGMYDTGVREFINGYFEVGGPRASITNIFISHSLRSAKLLFKYIDVCQLPPQLELDFDNGDCNDTMFN